MSNKTGWLQKETLLVSHKTLLVPHVSGCLFITLFTPDVLAGIATLFLPVGAPYVSRWEALIRPSPRLSVHHQTTKLACHFNFLQALVTAGPALSLSHSCKFHTLCCQKGFSLSISHLNRIHLSYLNALFLWLGRVGVRIHSRHPRDKSLHYYYSLSLTHTECQSQTLVSTICALTDHLQNAR